MSLFPYKIVDLTHPLDEKTPAWNGGCGFKSEIKLDYLDCKDEVKFRIQQFKLHAGIGTHIDAPAHCISNGLTVAEIPLQDLIAPCIVIDVSGSADENYSVSVEDIIHFETTHGTIQPNSVIMIHTGWWRYWDSPNKYRNNHRFPSVSKQAIEFLMKRKITGLGIDTLSPDRPQDGFPVHSILLGAGKYIIENVANLKSLPPTGSFVLALPIKVKKGTEAPIRLVALIPYH